MSITTDHLKASVIQYCAKIGKDPLLVQGAGGNASWKDEDTLWVKASGTWLAEAAEKDIFVPVDLHQLRKAIDNNDFSVAPKLRGESVLKPSIETLLHALMPHRVVVHLHAIEALVHLVRGNCQVHFHSLLDGSISWIIVDYHKPGAALAAAISAALAQKPMVKVVFLKNHGIVIGGEDVTEVSQILDRLTLALSTAPIEICQSARLQSLNVADLFVQYAPVAEEDLHQLALNSDLFKRLDSDWALYPDHVVFLGSRAYAYMTWEDFREDPAHEHELPELVFIYGEGVFVKATFNKAKYAQLRCYRDVIARQILGTSLAPLTDEQIAELLSWDAEHYRQTIAAK